MKCKLENEMENECTLIKFKAYLTKVEEVFYATYLLYVAGIVSRMQKNFQLDSTCKK